jgi:hypothetical protein
MSSQQPDLDALIAALQSDLPSERERTRMRARLLSAGIAVSAVSAAPPAAASGSALSAGAAQGASASVGVGAKLAGLSLAAKLGWSAAVIASASALSLVPLQQESSAGHAVTPSAKVPARAAVASAPAPTAAAAPEPTAAIAAQPIAHGALAAAVALPANELPATTAAPAQTTRPALPATAIEATTAPVPTMRRALPGRPPSSPRRASAPSPGGVGDAPAVSARPAPGAAAAEAPRVTVLREEAELLERALAALHDGDRAGADRWLAAHAARFPNGALRRERERAHRHLERLPTTATDPANGEREHD